MRIVIFILLVLLLTACSGEGGYCVSEPNKTVSYMQDGKLITEQGLTTCYDLDGNVKNKDN